MTTEKKDRIVVDGLYYFGKAVHKGDKILKGIGTMVAWTACTIVIDTLEGLSNCCRVLANVVDDTGEITREEVKAIWESKKKEETNDENTLESN